MLHHNTPQIKEIKNSSSGSSVSNHEHPTIRVPLMIPNDFYKCLEKKSWNTVFRLRNLTKASYHVVILYAVSVEQPNSHCSPHWVTDLFTCLLLLLLSFLETLPLSHKVIALWLPQAIRSWQLCTVRFDARPQFCKRVISIDAHCMRDRRKMFRPIKKWKTYKINIIRKTNQ